MRQQTLAFEDLDPENENPVLYKEFSPGFGVGLNRFKLTFHQNSITDCDISGMLTIRNFKNAANEPANINISVLINDDGFALTTSVEVGFLFSSNVKEQNWA